MCRGLLDVGSMGDVGSMDVESMGMGSVGTLEGLGDRISHVTLPRGPIGDRISHVTLPSGPTAVHCRLRLRSFGLLFLFLFLLPVRRRLQRLRLVVIGVACNALAVHSNVQSNALAGLPCAPSDRRHAHR